jgi:4-amino-4-deoxy-L-arabinose transferase-like glycosyltransferase
VPLGIGFALLALALRAALPFDGLYGQDAYAYFRYARGLWPWLLSSTPLPTFYWPAGYPLLVAVVLPLAGWGSAAGQLVSVASVAAAVCITAALTAELAPDAPGGAVPGLAAALAVALSGAALRSALVVMSDATAMACCAAALWTLARYRSSRAPGWLVGAALALAWAAISRWVCGLLAAPMLAFVLAPGPEPRNARVRRLIRHGAPALIIGALIVLPQAFVSERTPLALSQHPWVRAWSLENALARTLTTVDGTQHYRLPIAVFYLAQLAWPSFLPAPLPLAALAGALWLAHTRRWATLALLAGWPLLLWLFLAGIPYENPRFVLPALPALAALAGLGCGWAWSASTRFTRMRLLRAALAATLLAGLLASLGLGLRDYSRLVAAKQAELGLVAWASSRVPEGGTLVTFGPTLALQHYTPRDVRELFELRQADLDAIARAPRPAYLLLDTANVESQWAGLWPQQAYRSLLRRPGLKIAGSYGSYTLFRLR